MGFSGLRKWERETNTWTTYNAGNSGLSSKICGTVPLWKIMHIICGSVPYYGGLCKFDGSNWTVYNTTNSGIPTNLIVASLMDRNGNIWMGHGWENQGVTRFDGSNWTRYNTSNSGICNDTCHGTFSKIITGISGSVPITG